MTDTSIKLSGTYDSIEAYNILEEMREMSTDYEEIKEEAEAAASAATAAVTTAQTAANNASTYAGNAQTYAGNANTSAGEAAGYASNASTSATNAATSETNASNSASAAATSEANAATSETNAGNSATAASGSASAAAASAAEVEAALDDYLPLSGGTMTGAIKSSVETILARSSNDASIVIAGGSSWSNGAYLSLSGKDRTGLSSGVFHLTAKNDSGSHDLIGKPDGTLTWDGSNVLRSDMIVVEEKSGSVTVNAGSAASVDINVSKTGYTAIGIVGIRTSGNGATSTTYSHWYLDSATNAHLTLRNRADINYTWGVYVKVLYVKN